LSLPALLLFFTMIDSSGNLVVEYTYDAWGNVLSTTGNMAGTLGQDNPFRYRGYIYDVFTSLYFLGSRYYSPEMGRFICADGYASTGQGIISTNMFAYCNNNPVNMIDPTGNMAITAGLAGIIAGINAKLSNDSSGNSSTPRVTSQPNGLYGFNKSTVQVFDRNKTIKSENIFSKVSTGVRVITTIEPPENQYAAIEPFVEVNAFKPLSSTAGINFNTELGTIKLSGGLTETGIFYSCPLQWDSSGYGGIFFDFSEAALVIEWGTTAIDINGAKVESYTRFEVTTLLLTLVSLPVAGIASSVSGVAGGLIFA
jgi:RHS repeat-associated protein